MNKHIFFGVMAIDETIATFNIEPFHSSRYLFSCICTINLNKEKNETQENKYMKLDLQNFSIKKNFKIKKTSNHFIK